MNRYRCGGIIAHIIMQFRECMGNVYKQTAGEMGSTCESYEICK